MDNEEQTTPESAGFSAVPDEDEMPLGGADPGDDSDAPVELPGAESSWTPPGGHVRAENVTVSQGGAQTIEAGTVSITQGGAGRVTADELSVQQGGVGLARAERLTVQAEASAFAVVADNATIEDGANVFVLIGRNVSGDVRPVLDWRAALALGAGLAFFISLLRRIR